MKGEVSYTTSVSLGEKYRVKRYGIEGHAVEVRFNEHSESVLLERMEGPDLRRDAFHPSEVELVNEETKPTGFTGLP